jgi:fatty acid synthase
MRSAAKLCTNCFLLQQDNILGLEFSGCDRKGRRVMGMTPHGALASVIMADSSMLWDVPDHWTLEDAATVPVVYGTVS